MFRKNNRSKVNGVMPASSVHYARRSPRSATTSSCPPFSTRAKISLLTISTVIVLCYSLALHSVLTKHPILHPVALFLVVHSFTCLYHTLSPRPLYIFDGLPPQQNCLPCRKCNHAKPLRTRHCSKCRRCTPRMSHHCGILGVCIGLHNHKSFLHLLACAGIAGGLQVYILAPSALQFVVDIINGRETLHITDLLWLQAVYAQACLALIVGGLGIVHWYIAAVGKTWLEVVFAGCSTLLPWHSSVDWHIAKNLSAVLGPGWRSLFPFVRVDADAQDMECPL